MRETGGLVGGADGVGSDEGVGSAAGDGCRNNAMNVNRSWFCECVICIKWLGFFGGGAGGLWGGVVVWLENGFVVLEYGGRLFATF